MKIKTLAEILAESEADSASTTNAKSKKPDNPLKPTNSSKPNKPLYKKGFKKSRKIDNFADEAKETPATLQNDEKTDIEFLDTSSLFKKKPSTFKKRQKLFHPAATFTAESSDAPDYQPPAAQSIRQILAEVKENLHSDERNNDIENVIEETLAPLDNLSGLSISNNETNNPADNLPAALKAYLRTPEQRQADIDAIKAESRLRWLAFYYLSRREYGKAELKQKLLDKEQDPDKIDALLDEFEEKGYQSDYRTTLMLIRENIRKGRGRARIKQEFYTKKIVMPGNIDELIDMANAESEEFSEFIDDSEDSLVEGVDWLKLAVTARTKKYGDTIPTEQKEKAKQLRFLQYRGFNMDICFQALSYTLDTLDERF